MQWQEAGLILSVRNHAETSVIADIFTRSHGRFLGLVRSGRSKTSRALLQPGNMARVSWRARLEEHLGNFSLEPEQFNVASVFDDRLKLAGLTTLTSQLTLLPERDPHPALYDTAMLVLSGFHDDALWPVLLVRFEMALLEELGFGLDLNCCAASGATQELIYVSPKSGRAVSRQAGLPYHDKLLKLPGFLAGGPPPQADQDIADGYRLTGYFLNRHIYEARGLAEPQQRERIWRHFEK